MSDAPADYGAGPAKPEPPAPVVVTPIRGCITGDAKEVHHKVNRAAISNNLRRFLDEVLDHSWGDAGYQRLAGSSEPGLRCWFDLAVWAEEFEWRRQEMYRIREQAVALHFLIWEADPAKPGSGWLCWNLHFEEWIALDSEYRKARYRRPGAGRKPVSNGLQSVANCVSDGLRSPDIAVSNGLQSVAADCIKAVTLVSLDSASAQAPQQALRKVTRKNTEKKADASASGAGVAAPAPSSTHDESSHSHAATGKAAPSDKVKASKFDGEEQRYVRLLLKAIEDITGHPTAQTGKERDAAHWFYSKRGAPDIATVAKCYAIKRREPFYEFEPLSLQTLTKYWDVYQRNPQGFEANVKRKIREEVEKRARAAEPLSASNGHKPPGPSGGRSVYDVLADRLATMD